MSREDNMNLDPRLASELNAWAANERISQNEDRMSVAVAVDRERFVATRNALTNAFVGLSGAIDEAVKAYVNHTNAVLDGVGGSNLDVSGLIQPFAGIAQLTNAAQLAQHAMLQNGSGLTPGMQFNPDGTKKKRQYKPRDPNAPKRPLTAYFRYLQEQRPLIQAEIVAHGPTENGKAGDISKTATERWNALSKEQQAPYRQAYEKEMHKYYEDVKAYKSEGGQVDDTIYGDDQAAATPLQPTNVLVGAQHEDDDDDDDDDDSDESGSDDTTSESESESESEPEQAAEPAPPPPPPPPVAKPSSPEIAKKTAKSALKKTKAGADPIAPAQQFSSINPEPIIPPAPVPATSSPSRKRKVDVIDAGSEKKKKASRKTKAQQEAEESAAAAAQLMPEPMPVVTEKAQKDKKKKKRKSETAS